MISDNSTSSLSPPPPSSPPPEPSPRHPDRPGRGERIFTIAILSLLGIAFGLGIFTFGYARGFSYLSDDPSACVNCHIMRDQFNGWSHSSHKAVATCNDCHTPHRFPDKWVIKGINGWNHSVAFTTNNFPDPIMIRGFNARIAQENCVDCHATTVAQMHQFTSPEELHCVACHSNVGHDNAAPNTHFPIYRSSVAVPLPWPDRDVETLDAEPSLEGDAAAQDEGVPAEAEEAEIGAETPADDATELEGARPLLPPQSGADPSGIETPGEGDDAAVDEGVPAEADQDDEATDEEAGAEEEAEAAEEVPESVESEETE